MDNKFGIFVSIDNSLTSRDGNVCLKCYQANSRIADIVHLANVGRAPSIRICSGRDINSVEVMANFFGMVDIRMVAEGGAVLFNPTTHVIEKNPAITPDTEKLFRFLRTKEVPAILREFACLYERLGYMTCCILERMPGCYFEMQSVINFLEGTKKSGTKSLAGLWKKKPFRSPGLLTKFIRQRMIKIEHWSQSTVGIIPSGVSKASGTRLLMQKEDWNPAWCIAVGDCETDFSLFKTVGRIGCPSNATPGCIDFVKKNRGKVSQHSYTEGVLDVIDWYMNTEDRG